MSDTAPGEETHVDVNCYAEIRMLLDGFISRHGPDKALMALDCAMGISVCKAEQSLVQECSAILKTLYERFGPEKTEPALRRYRFGECQKWRQVRACAAFGPATQ